MHTAADLAGGVRTGDLDPVAVTEAVLARTSSGNALAEARAIPQRPDRAILVLAGVPIAEQDVTAVAGG